MTAHIHNLDQTLMMTVHENQQLKAQVELLNQRINDQSIVLDMHQKYLEGMDYERRGKNLIITGVSETANIEHNNIIASTDSEKVRLIMNSASPGLTERVTIEKTERLGKREGARPIKITVRDINERNEAISSSSNLKNIPVLSKIFIKRDTHPAIRKEWKRMNDVLRAEQQKPENQGCNVEFNKREKIITRDGVVIDRWRPLFD